MTATANPRTARELRARSHQTLAIRALRAYVAYVGPFAPTSRDGSRFARLHEWFSSLPFDAKAELLMHERNPALFEITEANKGNINPHWVRGMRANCNPQHDAAQRTFERRETAQAAQRSEWRKCVDLFARSVSEKAIRRARHDISHLSAELRDESESALDVWVGERADRAQRLARTKRWARLATYDPVALLLARSHALPVARWDKAIKDWVRLPLCVSSRRTLATWPKSLWRSALVSCEALQRKLSKADAVPCAFFDVFSTQAETKRATLRDDWRNPFHVDASESYAEGSENVDTPSAELCAVMVNARCDALRERIQARMDAETNPRSRTKSAGKQWLAYVERLRAYGLAAVDGQTFEPKQALTFARTTVHDVVETLSIRTIGADGTPGRYAAHDKRGAAAGTRKAKRDLDRMHAVNHLWDRARAFAMYVGVEFSSSRNGFARMF